MEFWQTIFATIIGGLITLAASFLSNRHEVILEKRKILVEKIEITHEITSRIERIYRKTWGADMRSLAQNKHQPVEHDERVPFEELEMLVSLYLPSLKQDVRKLIEVAREGYGPLTVKVISVQHMSAAERDELQKNIFEKIKEISACVERLQNGLANEFRQYL